jgi:hypothetical protein
METMTNAMVDLCDRQDKTEAHLSKLQEIIDDNQYKQVANTVGPHITHADVPAELQSVKQKIATIERKTIPDLQKSLEHQIKVLAGATHAASIDESNEPTHKVRSVKEIAKRLQECCNAVEKHRKRLKLVEELDGGTPIVKEVKQLQYLPHLQLAAHASAITSAPPPIPPPTQPHP